ncbi:hypothetical protein OE165_27495, partial [Escherichia coli]|uniref:hypothetical protein n=1 Tax=Escherichia coli TaxID=562 RepID=UPI0021F25575
IGMIAGTNDSVGFKYLFPVEFGVSDGTVALSETKIPNMPHHLQMKVGHTSMLWSRNVLKEIIYFIEHGHFSDH